MHRIGTVISYILLHSADSICMGIGSCDRAQAVSGIKKNDSPSPKSHQLLITPHLELWIPYLLLIPYWDFVGLDLVLVFGIQSQFLSVYTYNCLIVCVLMSSCRLIDVLVNPSTALAFVVFLPLSSIVSPEHWKMACDINAPFGEVHLTVHYFVHFDQFQIPVLIANYCKKLLWENTVMYGCNGSFQE